MQILPPLRQRFFLLNLNAVGVSIGVVADSSHLPGDFHAWAAVADLLGDDVPFIHLPPAVSQLMLDGKAVFASEDPEKIAGDLVQSLFFRLTKRLDELQQTYPIS
jgi:hypothetical protein